MRADGGVAADPPVGIGACGAPNSLTPGAFPASKQVERHCPPTGDDAPTSLLDDAPRSAIVANPRVSAAYGDDIAHDVEIDRAPRERSVIACHT